MPRTRQQLADAAEATEQWLDELAAQPDIDWETDLADLRAIGAAVAAVASAELTLEEAVQSARERGRHWGEIGQALGISKQAARERYMTAAPLG